MHRRRTGCPPLSAFALALPLLLALAGCADRPAAAPAADPPAAVEWALAIHGGAGVIARNMPEEEVQAYRDDLATALGHGRDLLAQGATSLDVVEQVVRKLEDSPLFNAGKGAVFTHDGRNELDAAIMDGRDLSCGAVAGVTTVKNPISLARGVMEQSPHVFFVGAGAEAFADQLGLERVAPDYFFVERRWQQLQELQASTTEDGDKHGTVGAVARDRHGDLAAATSTGGLTNKRFGRVGDVPVIGAGTYANNATAAISCTGYGEQFIRHNVAHDVSALIEYRGLALGAAAEAVIDGKLNPGDGGLIAVGRNGDIAMVFNSPGMFRGAADSSGRFDVAIWE